MSGKSAIAGLGATYLGNGRYAFPSGRTWYVTDASGLKQMSRYANHHTDYPHGSFIPMPFWWSPQKPFAVVAQDGTVTAFETLAKARWSWNQKDGRVITADLMTGKEIAA